MEKDALSLISIRELSALLRIHPKSAYKLVSSSDLPTVRLPGGSIRFRIETIEGWLKDRTKPAVPRLDSLKTSRLPIRDFDKMSLKGGRTMSAGKRTRWNYGFGAIYERKTKRDGVRWYLDYRDAKGRRVQKVAPL
jgi:excisionase family DNA binding protein